MVARAGGVKTQPRESLPQGMRSLLGYSRRRNLVVQQKLPAASTLLTYSDEFMLPGPGDMALLDRSQGLLLRAFSNFFRKESQ